MIRVRTSTGEVLTLKGPGNFVEIVDELSGDVGMAFAQVRAGELLQIKHGGQMAADYSKMFPGVKFCKVNVKT